MAEPWWRNTRGEWWVVGQMVLLGAVGLAPFVPGQGTLPAGLRPVGFVLMAVGALFILAGFQALGRNLSPFPRPISGGEMVQRGAYRLVRHPIYAGLVGASVGWALWTLSPLALLAALLLLLTLDRKAAREERWLREIYPGYAAYARRVRRLVPWLW